MRVLHRFGPLDVLAVIEKGRGYEDLIHNTVEIEFRGRTIRVLDLKTLVQLKKTSRDPSDRQCLAVLMETLRQVEEEQGTDEQILGRVRSNDESKDP